MDTKRGSSPKVKFYTKFVSKSGEINNHGPPSPFGPKKGDDSKRKTAPPKKTDHGQALPLGLKQGWLRTEISSLLGTSKQSCWFVVTASNIECYGAKRETDPQENPKFIVALGGSSSISEREGPSVKEPSFAIYCSTQKKKWFIETNNIEERNNWIHSIRCLIEVNKVDQNYQKVKSPILITDEHWIQQEMKKVLDYFDRVRRKVEDQVGSEKPQILRTYNQISDLLLSILGHSKVLLVNPTSEPVRESVVEASDAMKEFLEAKTESFKKLNTEQELKCMIDILNEISNRISAPTVPVSTFNTAEDSPQEANEEQNPSHTDKDEVSQNLERKSDNNNHGMTNNNNNNNSLEPVRGDRSSDKIDQLSDLSVMISACNTLHKASTKLLSLRKELKVSPQASKDIPQQAKLVFNSFRDIRQEHEELTTSTGYTGTEKFLRQISEIVVQLISSTKKNARSRQ